MRTLPQALRGLAPADQPFNAEISARLQALARQLDAAPH
jgi:hypothetical protein